MTKAAMVSMQTQRFVAGSFYIFTDFYTHTESIPEIGGHHRSD